LSQKTRDLVAAHSEDFVILACTILIHARVWRTDGWMDGQMDEHPDDG